MVSLAKGIYGVRNKHTGRRGWVNGKTASGIPQGYVEGWLRCGVVPLRRSDWQ